MDLAHYCVNAVLIEGRSVRDVAAATGRSKSWVHRHVQLYRDGGEAALVPLKTGPKVSPHQTSLVLEDEIVAWRKMLDEDGHDAGAKTIHYHLSQVRDAVPAARTIHRVLVRRGFVTPQPQKRPRNSWIRFEASLPNETWQSDMTHWQLRDQTPVEIINFIDDYSRSVLASVVVPVATAADVVRIFYDTSERYGLPQSVLSDNGAIYTSKYRGATTDLEIDLVRLGITFKHGKPYHPQTQGKVERYHRTLKKWLRRQEPASSIEQLQTQINRFVLYYNEVRPHQARQCPPMRAWRARDKATAQLAGQPILANTKVRRDVVDRAGTVTLRYRSKLHHIGLGRAHGGQRVLILMADLDVRVIDEGGVMIRQLTLDPSVNYQRQGQKVV
jgi:transposase InsO family protein